MNLDPFWAPHVGAVSLTFDDGTQNQLDKVVPALDRVGIKGSFYVRPAGQRWEQTRERWRTVAADGHEIGNHTLSHPCSSNFGGTVAEVEGRLDEKTLDSIEEDILAAQERLVEIAPHQTDWTFCYPCYQAYVGRGASRQSYVPVVARHFLAARGGGEYGFANHPAFVDLAYVWGLDGSRLSGFELIGLAEELTSQGRWVVFVFHAVQGWRLSVSGSDFQMLLGYLHRNAHRIWTAPLVEVAGRIAKYQSENRPTRGRQSP